MKILIKEALIIDPSLGINQVSDVLIEDGIIKIIKRQIDQKVDSLIHANGSILMPGLFDMHVHLREPGFEYKEDIATGTKAAARGGVTGVLAMPNTNPTVDSKGVVKDIKQRIKDKALIQVQLTGSITKKLSGKTLSDIENMIDEGIIAITDDGRTTMSEVLMKQAYQIIKPHNILLISHSEDHDIVGRGVIHEGVISRELGIDGIPAEVEYNIVKRDIKLSKISGARLHIAHISTEESVQAVREAQLKGMPVSAEACPHHFMLTHDIVRRVGTLAKVNPPIRSERHCLAVEKGIIEGVITCIATDHAPHTLKEKERDFYHAPFGISGVELSLSLSYSHFVKTNKLSWHALIERMAINPRKLLGLAIPTISVGQKANMTLFNPNIKRVIKSKNMISKGVNMPYENMTTFGDVVLTFYDGNIVYKGV